MPTIASAPATTSSTSAAIDCRLAIVAVGMGADTAAFPALAPEGARSLPVDPATQVTAVPGVFAAGDAVTGPTTIAEAVGQGRRAAFMIDRWLRDLPLTGFDEPLPRVERRRGAGPPGQPQPP